MIMEELQSSETEESNAMSMEENHVDEGRNNEDSVDYSDVFTTHALFDTRSDLINWARDVATQHMMILVVRRSDNGGGSKRGRVLLGCERGGEYRTYKGKPQVNADDEEGIEEPRKRRRKETKKCGCQFLLKGRQIHVMGPWTLSIDSAVHNHPIDKYLQSDSFGGLSSVEEELVLDLSKGDIQPKKSLQSLQKKDSMKDIQPKKILQSLEKKDSMKHKLKKILQSFENDSMKDIQPHKILQSLEKKDSMVEIQANNFLQSLEKKDSMIDIQPNKFLQSLETKDSMKDIQPNKILQSLEKKDSMNDIQPKKISQSLEKKDSMDERAGQSLLQYLMEKLKEHNYYFLDRRCKDTDTVRDLFFAHPSSVNLLRAFPNVLLMYCTHKTNKNRMPLLEIVGVTSTDMKFSVACVYMEAEKEDTYIWACSTLRALMDDARPPYLIVTDTNSALMNAVHVTFPTSSHFLCRWHINKNILANCKGDLKADEKWEEFNSYWQLLMFAEDEIAFNERYTALVEHFKGYPDPVKYVIEQWIEPYKAKFVACWTNQILHYGNTTIKRAESHHAVALNKRLGNSVDSFETCWDQIHSSYVASHTAIKCSFEKSMNVVYHKFKSVIFESLRGVVSIHALQLILDEVERGGKSEAGVDPRVCKCNLRKTCGLPCAHELTEYVREDKPIPLTAVDDFWKKLDMEETKVDLDVEFEKCITKLKQMFRNASEAGKRLLLKRLQELLKEFSKG